MASQLSTAGRGTGIERFGAQLRDLTERIRRLENRRQIAVGSWRITEDSSTGDLIATNSDSGAVVTLAQKEA